MRFSISKLCMALCALMLAAPAVSHADIIEINPKPKAKPKPKKPAPVVENEEAEAPKKKGGQHFEMRIHMSEGQASRDLAPLIVKRMSDYGFGMAPDVLYGDLYRKAENNNEEEGPRPPVYDHTFSFEVVKTDSSCFLVTKVVGEDVRQTQFRWETSGDGELPCELQAQQAMKEYVAKNPPKTPSKKINEIEAPFLAELKKAEDELAAKKEAEKKAEEEAAKKKREEAEQYRQQQELAEQKLLAESQPPKAGLSCSASSAASAPAFFGLWALLALPLRRSFRRRG